MSIVRIHRTIRVALLASLVALPTAAQTPLNVTVERLTLADAISQAGGKTASVELAELRVTEARAQVRETRSALLPRVNASAGWLNRTFNKHSFGIEFPSVPGQAPLPDLIGPFDTYDARLQVSQPILDFSAWTRMGASRSVVASTNAERDVTVETATQRAASAYLRGVRATATLQARIADVKLAAELLELAQAQETAGVGTAIDVTRAKTQKVAADGQVLVARNQLQQASVEMARALGANPNTQFEFADSLASNFAQSGAPADVNAATTAALQNRPELQAEAMRMDAIRRNRKSIVQERLPRIDIAADYGTNGPQTGTTIPTGQVGLQVSVPIVDGFRREARLAEQDAELRQSEVRERDTREQIAGEVRSSLLDLASAGEQQQIAAERLQLAEEELSQARERFRNGVAGNIEIINAQSSLNRARDAVIDARFVAGSARISLAHAVGVARSLH